MSALADKATDPFDFGGDVRPIVCDPWFWMAAVVGVGADGVEFCEQEDCTFKVDWAV